MPYRLLSRVSSERSNVLIMFYIFFQGLRAVLQTSLVIAWPQRGMCCYIVRYWSKCYTHHSSFCLSWPLLRGWTIFTLAGYHGLPRAS